MIRLINEFKESLLRRLAYGYLELRYETYWHSMEHRRIVLYSANKLIYSVTHVDNEDAVDEVFEECQKIIDRYKTRPGMQGYVDYHHYYDIVLDEVRNVLKGYKEALTIGNYDPVSGERLD